MNFIQIIIYFKGTSTTPVSSTPQKVQIIRSQDGKLQVKGLLPGQQLYQMPDGKLHVLNTSVNATPIAAATPEGATKIIKNPINSLKLQATGTPGKITPNKIETPQIQTDSNRQVNLQQVVKTGQRLKVAANSGNLSGATAIQSPNNTFVIANNQIMQGAQVIKLFL